MPLPSVRAFLVEKGYFDSKKFYSNVEYRVAIIKAQTEYAETLPQIKTVHSIEIDRHINKAEFYANKHCRRANYDTPTAYGGDWNKLFHGKMNELTKHLRNTGGEYATQD